MFYENPYKRFRRLRNIPKLIQMFKKRILNSAKVLKVVFANRRKEAFAEKLCFPLQNLKDNFVKRTKPLESYVKLSVLP